MAERLKDKVAIVTGAGAIGPGWGNGKAAAVLFAREGARVFAVDINPAAAEETKAIIAGEGGACTAHPADVSRSGEVEAMVNRCFEVYGRIDVLHNNVGICEVGGIAEASEESWDRVIAVNLKSVYLTCRHTLPHMVGAGGGTIVNISSAAALRHLGVSYDSYSVSKAGIRQITQNIAIQYAGKNIRCNDILPGLMKTPFMVESLKAAAGERTLEEMIEARRSICPMKRLGDGWDVAYAALFLASDEAKYITGAELVVDGGLTCKVS